MNCDILELDVFATGPFTGNPLAVIAGADDLDTPEMLRIASWLNYSESTFLLPPADPGADYRVRIFTPTEEFDFAGHPTLGTARAWLELGGKPRSGDIIQECGVGLVDVCAVGDTLAFAAPPLRRGGPLEVSELDAVIDAFGLGPGDIADAAWGDNGPGWRLVELHDVHTLRSLRPSVSQVKVGFVALTGEADPLYEVRAFTAGREDPVTGSLNGALAQWLRGRGAVPASYAAAQGMQVGRRGRIEVRDDGRGIWIGGAVHVRVRGVLEL